MDRMRILRASQPPFLFAMSPSICLVAGLFALLSATSVLTFPTHGSLAGLSRSELDAIIPTLERRAPESPPGPLNDTSARLVVDPAHPFIAPKATDIRGPCPGLNTLASHGVRHSCHYVGICIIIQSIPFDSTFLGTALPLLHRLSTPFKKVRISDTLQIYIRLPYLRRV